jgi:glycosyltransferase involved in cell wall biosynthesis
MVNIAWGLSQKGWAVDVLSPAVPSSGGFPVEDVNIYEFSYPVPNSGAAKLLNSVRGAQTIHRLYSRIKYDVVLDDISHVPFYPAHYLAPAETTNSLFMHTAYFGTARQFLGTAKGAVIDIIDRTLPYLRSPEIVCAGPSTQRNIRETLGYDRTHVLRPCIDTTKFEYQFEPTSQTILYLGRLTKRKNVGCLLRAWNRVETQYPEYELVIAGTGPREDELRAYADQNLSNVEFRGYVDEVTKRRLYRDALLFVFPSLLEGYATTGLEAMASGTPVVGADTDGINDYVSHSENGYLFDPDDSSTLAAELKHVLADPTKLEPLAQRGRDLACEHARETFGQRANAVFSALI